MSHPAPELLLLHAEGGNVPAEAAAHIAACRECRAALAEIGRLETQLASAAELPAGERATLQAATARLLSAPRRRSRPGRGAGAVLVVLAAALLATLLLWSRPDGLTASVHRYDPGVVRSGQLERFSLTVHVDARRWLSLWQVDAAAHKQLLPHADPLLRWLGSEMPLAAGEHRLPGVDVLDFEFPAAQPPSALLLVAHADEPSGADLTAIDRLIATTPRDQLREAVRRQWPEARLLPFPAR